MRKIKYRIKFVIFRYRILIFKWNNDWQILCKNFWTDSTFVIRTMLYCNIVLIIYNYNLNIYQCSIQNSKLFIISFERINRFKQIAWKWFCRSSATRNSLFFVVTFDYRLLHTVVRRMPIKTRQISISEHCEHENRERKERNRSTRISNSIIAAERFLDYHFSRI